MREHVGHLERRVELIPVRAGAEPAEIADVDARQPGVAVFHVAIEAGDAQRRARVCRTVDREGIERVEVHPVVADPEVVEQVRLQRVGIPAEPVVVDARLRHRGRRDRGVEDVAAEAVVPVVADVQPDLVADVLIDAARNWSTLSVFGLGPCQLFATPVRLAAG